MITAAASAFPYLRPSVTSVSAAQRGAHGEAAVTCGYTVKVTIYNCRNRPSHAERYDLPESHVTLSLLLTLCD